MPDPRNHMSNAFILVLAILTVLGGLWFDYEHEHEQEQEPSHMPII
jgi:hypothetical protein